MKIWVIEDNYLHSTFVRYVLKDLKLDFKIFNSVKEVFNYIKNKEYEIPDIVIIDLILGDEIRGEELLKILKKEFKNNNTKFIAFTADIIYEKKLKEQGFDKILFKPVNKDILKKTIMEFL